MRTYRAVAGFREGVGVQVEDDVAGEIAPLPRHSRHSPDGHAWGYGGSGPTQLALDLLWHVYGLEPAPALYQAFKFDVISQLNSDAGWTMTENQIRDYVDGRGGFAIAGY